MSPDRRLLRRKALISASRVVLAMGIAACAGSTPAEEDDDWELSDLFGGDAYDDTGVAGAPDCTDVAAEDIGACCEELASWCEEEHGMASAKADECYYGPDYDGSTGCIPWGPPVPPRFSGVA